MDAPIAGFLKLSTTDGRTLYINPNHVTAVEVAGEGASMHLHSGEKISLAEKAEEILDAVHDVQGEAAESGRHLRQRLRERRRHGRFA